MSIRQVSRATGIPSATLGGYFSGRHLPTVSQTAAFHVLLEVLGADDEAAWQDALERARRAGRERRGRTPAPYRGLESYDVDDAEWFVGREDVVAELAARVAELRAQVARPQVLTVLGASGSGKSSLLRAGLVARARAEGAALRAGLVARARAEGAAAEVTVPGAAPLAAVQAVRRSGAGPEWPDLLVLDQLEELFSDQVDATERTAFLELLTDLAGPGARTVVVLGLRADFFGTALDEPALFPLVSTQSLVVGPMSADALRRVIVEPAARAGWSVENELVDLLVRDVSAKGTPDPGSLPLLSHALLTTWNRSADRVLRAADYLATGGVAGAVQRTAEEVYTGLTPAGQETARALLSQLVSVDDDGTATRRRVGHAELMESHDLAEVIEAFVSQRILTATASTLEISHEVLIEVWPRLRDWVAEDRDDLTVRRRVASSARDWESTGRDPGGLLRGSALALAAGLLERQPGWLSASETALVEASTARQQAEQRDERHKQQRLLVLLGVVAALALIASGLSIVLVRALDEAAAQRDIATTTRDEALSRQVALQATQLRETDPPLAMQLALAAYDIAPTVEATSAVLDVSATGVATRLVGVEGEMRAVASPDGSLLATVAANGKVRIWDSAEGEVPRVLATVDARGGGGLYAAEFSPDGALLAVGGSHGRLTLLDVSDPAHPTAWPAELDGPGAAIQAVAFAANGSQLWAATSGPGLFGWRLAAGTAVPLASTDAFGGSVQYVAVAPDGRIATGSGDGAVRLWSVTDGRLRLLHTLPAGRDTNWVNSVAFSPDGGLLAAAGRDRQVRLWDVSGAEPREAHESLTGYPSYVNAVAFDADGGRLGVAGSSGIVQTWRTEDWTLEDSFVGDTNYTSLAFVAGTERVLTGSIDGVTRVWLLDGPRVTGFGDSIWALSYTADGDLLYVGVGNNDPRVVELDSSEPWSPRATGRQFLGPPDAGTLDGVVAVSPDGRRLVAGTLTGDVVTWDLEHPAHRPVVLQAASALIENVQFSPDGRHFATAADDGSVKVYDATAAGPPRLEHDLSTGTVTIGLGFNHDGSLLAAGTADDEVRLWRLGETVEGLPPITGFDNDVYAVLFSPDRRTLVTGGVDEVVRLWDVSDPTAPVPIGDPLRGPTDTVWGVSASPDGSELAAASADGHLWVWSFDGARARLRAELGGLGTETYQVAHHPTAAGYAGAGADGVTTFWTTDVDTVRERICAAAGTPITRQEWAQYVPDTPYAPPC